MPYNANFKRSTTMENQDYETFVKEEIEKIEKETKFIWGSGVLIMVLVIGYLFFLFQMTAFITKPENAAILVANSVKDNLPEFLDQTEQTLTHRAPIIARETSDTFLEMIPRLREAAETQIDFTHKEMIPQLSWEFQQILSNYIRDHEKEIRTFAAQDHRGDFPKNFVEELMGQFGQYLDQEMSEKYGGRDMDYLKENSLLALQAMNEFLVDLKETPSSGLERKERLQRKILATVTRRLIEVPQ